MRLAEYLKVHNMTGSELAGRVGVSESTINRLIPKPGKRQHRQPSLDLMRKIREATNGAVTADDFLDDDHPAATDTPAGNGRAA